MTHCISRIIQRFNKWRLVLLCFLLVYSALLVIDLDYNAIQWDETPHLYGSLLLSRGQFEEYLEAEAFYPPMFDLVSSFFFNILGPSLFSARLVAVIFGVFSVWVVFETANQMYGPKTGLIASILLASMPGFVWLSRIALLETMLLFFFSASLFLFFSWMRTNNNKLLILTGITLGLGFLVKYQALVAGIVMLIVLLFMGKQKVEHKLGKFLVIVLIAAAVALPWFICTYEKYAEETFGTWLYSLQMGNEERLEYSTRFPWPVFYLMEMMFPYPNVHPISIFVYLFTLFGLGFLLKRRRQEDKFLLIGFFVIFSVFTLITSKDWRYITLVFPILAISGSTFIVSIFDKAKARLKAPNISLSKKRFRKYVAASFLMLVIFSVVYSVWDSYMWLESEHFNFPVGDACQYVSDNSGVDETTVALFTTNFFSFEMMRFYLQLHDSGQRRLLAFPEDAVDVYQPLPNDERFFFSLNKLINRFELMNVKYLILIEWERKFYFKSYYDSSDVLENLNSTGHFMLEKEFGTYPHRMFIIRFLPNS